MALRSNLAEPGKSIGQLLEELANTNTSSEQDSVRVENFLRRVGFPQARVVAGIVYLEGKGTLESPPVDIHSVAKVILNKFSDFFFKAGE